MSERVYNTYIEITKLKKTVKYKTIYNKSLNKIKKTI